MCVQGSPMLVGTAVANDNAGFVMVPLHRSKAVLPELRVTDSSEAMLSGRKPPLRLMMRCVHKSSLEPAQNVRYAISEGFVVAVCPPLCSLCSVRGCITPNSTQRPRILGNRTRADAFPQTRQTCTVGKYLASIHHPGNSVEFWAEYIPQI